MPAACPREAHACRYRNLLLERMPAACPREAHACRYRNLLLKGCPRLVRGRLTLAATGISFRKDARGLSAGGSRLPLQEPPRVPLVSPAAALPPRAKPRGIAAIVAYVAENVTIPRTSRGHSRQDESKCQQPEKPFGASCRSAISVLCVLLLLSFCPLLSSSIGWGCRGCAGWHCGSPTDSRRLRSSPGPSCHVLTPVHNFPAALSACRMVVKGNSSTSGASLRGIAP